LAGKTRVLVVDDSLVVREMLTRILNQTSDIEVVGVAVNGKDAVLQTAKLRPDFITMDIRMPVMDGFQATEQIMAYYPTPILVFSASIHEAELRIAFRALAEGALDVMEKPSMEEDWSNLPNIANELVNRVRILSSARVIAHPKGRLKADQPYVAAGNAQLRVVAIGSSTGGPGALSKILPRISPQLSAGIVIAQHISQSFVTGLVKWLDEVSVIKVKEAEEGEPVRAGVALISPADFHMAIGEGGTIRLVDPSKKEGIVPSADLLLSSAAEIFGAQAIGVILTGMGSDGAQGLKKIRESGGMTIAQDESSSIVYGMPRVAVESGAAQRVMALDSIAEGITNLVTRSYIA
jgi:two-component system chemotaxis response regulator CheB